MHVSCEFNRLVDTHFCKVCDNNRSRVFHFFLAMDYWPVTPLDATRVEKTTILIGSISN